MLPHILTIELRLYGPRCSSIIDMYLFIRRLSLTDILFLSLVVSLLYSLESSSEYFSLKPFTLVIRIERF